MLVATKQAKHTFVTTKNVLSRQTRVCRDKSMLVVTKVLSRQNYVCRDKGFVATSILLSRQKT